MWITPGARFAASVDYSIFMLDKTFGKILISSNICDKISYNVPWIISLIVLFDEANGCDLIKEILLSNTFITSSAQRQVNTLLLCTTKYESSTPLSSSLLGLMTIKFIFLKIYITVRQTSRIFFPGKSIILLPLINDFLSLCSTARTADFLLHWHLFSRTKTLLAWITKSV